MSKKQPRHKKQSEYLKMVFEGISFGAKKEAKGPS